MASAAKRAATATSVLLKASCHLNRGVVQHIGFVDASVGFNEVNFQFGNSKPFLIGKEEKNRCLLESITFSLLVFSLLF